MNDIYKKQVALLIRIMPSIYRIQDFAVHGGTAINLFHKNMPRYSIDIDLTYIPVQEREESLNAINKHLRTLKSHIEKSIPDIKVIPKLNVWKLQCTLNGATVKIEVNGTKRGIIGATEDKMLCEKARSNLITQVNDALTETDKKFLLSFEGGVPDWKRCCIGDLSNYPSVKWKLQNIAKLKRSNPQKHRQGVEKLQKFFEDEVQ